MYLNCHSYYSLQYGVMPIPDLIAQAAERGINRLGLTDINSSAGVFEFSELCLKAGISPIVGIDFRTEGTFEVS